MHRLMSGLARTLAIIGGLVLISLIVITCLSIAGRLLNTIGHSDFVENNLSALTGFFRAFGPINGDYELVEAGVAFAIFTFLPWCQLNRAHATVELLTAFIPNTANRFLTFLWELIFTLVMFLIAWRLYVGMTDKMRYGETTYLLQFPVWWGYALCAVAAVIACIVAVYSTWLRGAEAFANREPAIAQQGGGH
ncbi:MAG: TRAP transporter small permease [Pseudomonadota bacterium]